MGIAHAADEPSEAGAPPDATSQIAVNALSLLGVSYRYGGTSPDSGFDCSGFVRHVFQEAIGWTLPRRSVEISRLGGRVAPTDLQPGDLVFFNTLRRAFSHVGIYIGQGRFVHAPSSGGGIRVEQMDAPYWVRHFNGGRRLLTGSAPGAPGGVRFAGRRQGAERLAASERREVWGAFGGLPVTVGSDAVNPL